MGFAIISNFIDEVELNVVPLDIFRIFLESPYLNGKKVILYREENKYNIKKDWIEYIVRALLVNTKLYLVSTRQVKRLVNACKFFVFMIVKYKDDVKFLDFKGNYPKYD